jgi:hypothetical protein
LAHRLKPFPFPHTPLSPLGRFWKCDAGGLIVPEPLARLPLCGFWRYAARHEMLDAERDVRIDLVEHLALDPANVSTLDAERAD